MDYPKFGDGQLLHAIQDEMHDMIGGHPFPKIIRQKHRCLAVQVYKSRGHTASTRPREESFAR